MHSLTVFKNLKHGLREKAKKHIPVSVLALVDSTPAVTQRPEACPDNPYLPPNPSSFLVWDHKQTEAGRVVPIVIIFVNDQSILTKDQSVINITDAFKQTFKRV